MVNSSDSCIVEIRRILRAGIDEDAAIMAFHALVDARGCAAVRRALAAVERGLTN